MGKNYPHNYILFDDIQKGGSFTFHMSEHPNKDWGESAGECSLFIK